MWKGGPSPGGHWKDSLINLVSVICQSGKLSIVFKKSSVKITKKKGAEKCKEYKTISLTPRA